MNCPRAKPLRTLYLAACALGAGAVLVVHIVSYVRPITESLALGSLGAGVLLCAPLVPIFLRTRRRTIVRTKDGHEFWHAAYRGAPQWMWQLGGIAALNMLVVGFADLAGCGIAQSTFQSAAALIPLMVAVTHAAGRASRTHREDREIHTAS